MSVEVTNLKATPVEQAGKVIDRLELPTAASPYTVTGLDPAVKYTFNVRAPVEWQARLDEGS